MKPKHLRGRKTAEHILRKGKTWKGNFMIIRWFPAPPRHGGLREEPGVYLGTFASAKLSKSAVIRNRMRRRCRESLRTTLLDIETLPPVQLLVCPRFASLKAPFGDVLKEARTFLSFLSTCLKQPSGPASSNSR
jgi:ribonuclease P protein component